VLGAEGEGSVALARALGSAGVTVVLSGSDAAALGALVPEVEDAGGRAAVFVGTDPAVRAELIAEMFGTR